MAKISVILPIYNGAKHLNECIESVRAQTFRDWELLAINEFGSDDGSAEIVSQYHERDSRIVLVQNDAKLGLAESLNRGIRMAKSDYLARLDADDLAHPTRFQKQYDIMRAHPEIGVCGSWQHHFGPQVDWIHKPPSSPDACRASLLFNCEVCHSTVMLRKSTLERYKLFYDSRFLAEDYELWTRACCVTDIYNLPEVLGEYRWDGDNITADKKALLNTESGLLAAANIKRTLNYVVPEASYVYLCGWENPFDHAPSRAWRKRGLQELERILRGIYMVNEQKAFFDPQCLLNVLGSKWRWARDLEPREDTRYVPSLQAVFSKPHRPVFLSRLRQFCANHRTLSAKCEKMVQLLLDKRFR